MFHETSGKRLGDSDVEQEVHHIAILDDVLFAFGAHLARVLGALLALELDEVVEGGQVVGHINYRQGADGVVDLPHTEINPANEGQGLGTELARSGRADAAPWTPELSDLFGAP